MKKLNTMVLYQEQLSLMIPKNMLSTRQQTIGWKEAAELPLCLLSPNMKERQVMDEAFASIDCDPSPKLECNSIFQLAFHVMQGDLATIVPNGFSRANDAFPGTREVQLIDPIISKPVGLIWEKVAPPLPMAQAMADLLMESKNEIQEALGKSTDLPQAKAVA